MKNCILFMISIMIIMIGCTDLSQESVTYNLRDNGDHIVTLNAVRTLAGLNSSTRTEEDLTSGLVLIKDNTDDTLLFLCDNNSGGWKIYSSDTRVPPVIAKCDNGSIADILDCPPVMAWIETMADDMKDIKHSEDSEITFTAEEIAESRKFWAMIDNCIAENVITDSQDQESVNVITPNPIPLGHYELYATYTDLVVYDSIPHLIVTNWNQGNPYNAYCPFKSGSSDSRAFAGCTPIAAGQMLYFLHYKFGVPQTAPSKAYCYGRVTDSDYNWNQYEFNNTIWDKMPNEQSDYQLNYYSAAPLIAHIGKLANTNYGDDGSSTDSSCLPSKVFAPYGISCTFNDYDTEKLKRNLLEGMPVIVRADGKDYSKSPPKETGHTFIADRYQRTAWKTTMVYRWKYDYEPVNEDGTLIPLPYVKDDIIVRYDSPNIAMIGFNWGWGSHILNDAWFALTGDWTTNSTTYNKNKKMITGFKSN